ncbi:MAG: ATP-binding protein [Atopobiaceae bacterium]|nr:ATP-binding protein [Atopobiaceae bacterium]
MGFVGREKEMRLIDRCCESGRPEFVAIYGRRRVGKTLLVRKYFVDGFSFYATGIAEKNMKVQLKVFNLSLIEYGSSDRSIPADWFEAFTRLKTLLQEDGVRRDRASGRRVVFLDELPWFDTPRSSFKAALDWFWNGWASNCKDLMLVVCGSATSWMLDNLVDDHGGFYNRVTRQIHLMPFTLAETEQLFLSNRVALPRQQVIEAYMVFGGIPHYLNLVDRRSSLAQNVDQLCFQPTGELQHECDRLFRSLFKHADIYEAIISELSERLIGKTRVELASAEGIGGGKRLTKALRELEQCGFIRKYQNYRANKNGHFYQLVDPFTLFSWRLMRRGTTDSWTEYRGTPSYFAWVGHAFELVCLLHVRQLKHALGIAGVQTKESAWRSRENTPGAQVDLLIDRRDGVIDLCEMKYSGSEFVIDADYARKLNRKLETFVREEHPKKALHLVMVTSNGVAHNAHYDVLTDDIGPDALFAE